MIAPAALVGRPLLGRGAARGAVMALVALCVGALIAFRQVPTAAAAVALILVLVGLVVSGLPQAGLFAGILAVLLVPYSLMLVGPCLAFATVVAARRERRRRLTFVDVMVVLYVLGVIASWVATGPVDGSTGKLALAVVSPLAFYLAGTRVSHQATEPVLWVLLTAGAVAATTLFFELLVTHRPLFVPEQSYLWSSLHSVVSRPGGVLRSPPGAADVLAMTSLAALPLLTRVSGRKRALAGGCLIVSLMGIVATLERSAMIAGIVGGVLYLVLSRTVHVARLLLGAAAVIGVLLVAVPLIGSTTWYRQGVLRRGTLAARQSTWASAWPLTTNSVGHGTVGHGINSLEIGKPETPGRPDPDVVSDPQLLTAGPHSQYIRTLFEQGALGLVVLVGWLGGAILTAVAAVRVLRGRPERAVVAAAAAGIAAFMIESAAGDTVRELPTFAVAALLAGIVVAHAARTRASPVVRGQGATMGAPGEREPVPKVMA